MAAPAQPVSHGTIAALIDALAERDGARPAVLGVDGAQALDAAALRMAVRRVAAALQVHGVRPGARVAYAMHNGVAPVVAVLGIQYAGACAVAVNLVAGREVIGYVLAHSRAAHVICTDDTEAMVHDALSVAPLDGASPPALLPIDALLEGDASSLAATAVQGGDDALLMYTSGTTGRPKGVRLSQANLLAGGRNVATGHGLRADDRALCVLPLFHINGLCVTVYGPLVSGGSVVVPPRFSASRFWSWIALHRCSWFSVVPTQVAYLLHGEATSSGCDTLRFGRSASAPLAPDVLHAFEARFAVPLIETMGLTETAAQITCNPRPPGRARAGSAGRAHGCELRIVPLSADAVDTAGDGPAGAEGEIQVRGDSVMQGYLDDAPATEASFSDDGWFRTGDLGRLDADGFLFVTGRLKELIIKGGENIAPREIDEALQSHPDVLEAAAFAVPCPDYGERVEAAVVAVPGRTLDLQHVQTWCTQRLGPFKSPDRLHRLDALPKGPSGKIQRRHCASMCSEKPPL